MLNFKSFLKQRLSENVRPAFPIKTAEQLKDFYFDHTYLFQDHRWSSVNGNGEVGIDTRVRITETLGLGYDYNPYLCDDGTLKFKFKEVHKGSFEISSKLIKSMEGMPKIITKSLSISNERSNLKDYEHWPKEIRECVYLSGFNGTSLVGISKAFNKIDDTLFVNFSEITEGGIELINIDVRVIEDINGLNGPEDMPEPFKIIQKYLGKPDEMFDCQAELIENGFEEFAKL